MGAILESTHTPRLRAEGCLHLPSPLMDLPKLSPGKRFALPRPPGSADALLLARLAAREKAAGRPTAIVTSGAADAQRLMDELAFFAPDLRCALFPDWETLPYDTLLAAPGPDQRTPGDAVAHLAGRGRCRHRAGHHGAVPRGAAVVPGRLHVPVRGASRSCEESKLRAQLTLAGYNHVTQVVSPGEYAVRGGLIDLFPMGSAVPYRVDLFDDEIDSIRTFDPDSQRSLYPVPEVRLLPGREFPMDDDGARALPQPLARTARRRPDQEPHLQGHGQRRRHVRHRVLPAAVLRGDGDGVRLPRPRGHRGAARRPRARVPALLAGHARPPPPAAGRPRAAHPAARGAVPHHRAVLRRPTSTRSCRCARRRRTSTRQRLRRVRRSCPTCPWCAAPRTRWRA